MQRISIVDIVFCHTHKQFHPSHATVADLDSSDSNRLYPPDEFNSIPTEFLLSAPREASTSKIEIKYVAYTSHTG
jgi:hypothetical protein